MELCSGYQIFKAFQSEQVSKQPEIINLLAIAYLKTKDIENAEILINEALSESPRSRVYYIRLLIKKQEEISFQQFIF